MDKSRDAFRTISEVAEWLDTPTYVLRFWESRFPQIKPVKRAGGRRYYRPEDMKLLGGIKKLLHFDGNTIKGVQNLIKDKGVKFICDLSPGLDEKVVSPDRSAHAEAKAELESLAILKPEPPLAEKTPEKPTKPRLQLTESDKADEQTANEQPAHQQPTDAAPKNTRETEPKISVTVHKKTKIVRPEAEPKVETEVKAEPAPVTASAEPVATTPQETKIEPAEKPAGKQGPESRQDALAQTASPQPDLPADFVQAGPYLIRAARNYAAEDMREIETLYYSLKMVRNNMKRAAKTG